LVTVDRAFMVLQGHRSIVNQVRFNSANHMLISAGVEKILKVWSPFPIPGGYSNKDVCPGNARQLYSHGDYLGFIRYGGLPLSHDEYDNRSTEEDPRMLAFFDSLIQREKDSFHSDSDDSVWDDLHLSIILQAGSSEGSDSETMGTSVNRLLAREILHRPGEGSPDSSSQGVLRRLRHLRNAAVIRDLLNGDSSSDEETRNHIQIADTELPTALDNGQSSTHAPVTFNKTRRHTNRRYRFHNRLKAERDRSSLSHVVSDSSSTDSESESKTNTGENSPYAADDSSSSGTEETKENIDSVSDDAQHGNIPQEATQRTLQVENGQSSVNSFGTCEIECKGKEQNLVTVVNNDGLASNDRANGNTHRTINHNNERSSSLKTDSSNSSGNNYHTDAERSKRLSSASKKHASFTEENQPDDEC